MTDGKKIGWQHQRSGRSIADILEHVGWSKGTPALADDSELDRERLTNWSDRLPTRALIHIMIAHDFYHAGEINHLRALLQQTERWSYDE